MTSLLESIDGVSAQTFYLAASAFFGVGLFLHWFLFLAFLCVLPPLHQDIENLREQLSRIAVPTPSMPKTAPKTAPVLSKEERYCGLNFSC